MTKQNQNGQRGKLLVIVGPTAVGKTALSLSLANEFGGEIVSADSRLFYKGMDIGTAKPSKSERSAVPHHLIDICHPDQTLTLGEYQRLAYHTIEEILDRDKLPILVGGTGQYVMAVVEGWGIPEIAPKPELRRQLEQLGPEELARWLGALDPPAAERIDPRNIRRVVRALEVTFISGRPISELQQKTPPPYDIHIIGLHRDRATLYERIDHRVDDMLTSGLVEEVTALKEQGYRSQLPAMSGLGYRQILTYLRGEMPLDEAVDRIKFETHRFARQQATWFRQDDPRITWFDLATIDSQTVHENIQTWLTN
jgi:tRNA dimethylallyltransferase